MGLWSSAVGLAEKTPESRNRYVDLLRAVSILAVISGHWLIAAPYFDHGELRLGHMLDISPWTQWLTWVFQVMPIFFLVGGYSNAASWSRALERGQSYATWLEGRLHRLIGPLMPLVLLWIVIAIVARQLGVSAETIRIGSQAALVPLWFLSVYVLVALLVPLTWRAWRRFGIGSFWGLASGAILVDVLWFAADLRIFGWLNYLFIWLAMHQLGYLWREGRLGGPARALPWGLVGLVALIGMVTVGPYPLSMVSVPGEDLSNTLPPKLPMLALGLVQLGLLLSLEPMARRALAGVRFWAATVLVNGMIMTIYLWHLTAMIVTITVSAQLGGPGLRMAPGSSPWWYTRPPWMLVLVAVLLPLVLIFNRFERPSGKKAAAARPAWRLVIGAVLVCGGLALIALDGLGQDNVLGLKIPVALGPVVGALLIYAGPRPRAA
jgi:fucose 4-O-acetylase-like acetyltransferase